MNKESAKRSQNLEQIKWGLSGHCKDFGFYYKRGRHRWTFSRGEADLLNLFNCLVENKHMGKGGKTKVG